MQFSDYQQFFSTAFVDRDGKAQQPFDYQRRLALDEARLRSSTANQVRGHRVRVSA